MDRVTKEAAGRRAEGQARPRPPRSCSPTTAGIDVPTVTGLRDEFRKAQCEYKVYKNTLVKLADQGHPDGAHRQAPRGPDRDHLLVRELRRRRPRWPPSSPRTQEKFVLKGGYFEGTVLDAKGVEALAHHAGQGRAAGDAARDVPAPAAELRRDSSPPARRTSCTCSPRASERSAKRTK